MSDSIRLQKFIAQAGLASRRSAEELISSGKVKVNGEVVTKLGTKVVPGKDKVVVNSQLIKAEAKRVYLFFKPRKVISTLKDPEGRACIGDYLKDIPVSVYPVGRLDFDVSGLIVLTNDGEFGEKLLHPRYQKERVYWAVVKGVLLPETMKLLKSGIKLEDGMGKLESVRVLNLDESKRAKKLFNAIKPGEMLIELVATEGRNHFIKRIMERAGHPVSQLCRVAFGSYHLGRLRPGEIKEQKNSK